MLILLCPHNIAKFNSRKVFGSYEVITSSRAILIVSLLNIIDVSGTPLPIVRTDDGDRDGL